MVLGLQLILRNRNTSTQMKLHFVFALAILVKYAGGQCIDTWPSSPGSSTNITLCDSCTGSCDSSNGCTCVDGFDFCLPNVNTTCIDPTICCPEGLYYNNTDFCCTTTPTCVIPCASDEICDSKGQCVCDRKKYPGLTRDNIYRKIECENNLFTVTVSKCQLEVLGYNTSTIHLRDSSDDCKFFYPELIDTRYMISVQNELNSSWCGNIVEADNFTVNFTNTFFIGILNKPLITVNPFSFNYTCAYKRDMQTSLKLPGNITTQTVQLPGINGTGSYPLTMGAFKDYPCTQPFVDEEEVIVGTDIYIALFVTGADGKTYVLRVETCVASPTDNRTDVNAFALIENGCTKELVSTNFMEQAKSLQSIFRISSFQFRNQPFVNIFCDVRLCVNSTEDCSACIQSRSAITATKEVKVGLNIADYLYNLNNAGAHAATSWALLAGIQLAIAFIKFF